MNKTSLKMEFNLETATMADLGTAKAYCAEQFSFWFDSYQEWGVSDDSEEQENCDRWMEYHSNVSEQIENEIGRRLEAAFPPPFEK